MINSGSAFRRHPLLFYGSQLMPVVPEQLFDFSSFALAPFLSDWRRLMDDNRALITPPFSVQLVPKSTVIHRLNCMANFAMGPDKLSGITARTLFVASGKDRIFPSIAEARRLMQEVPTCKLHVAPESGHAVLLEEGTCLAQIISDAGYLPPKPVPAAYAAMDRPGARVLWPDVEERAAALARITAEVSRSAEAASAAATRLTNFPGDEAALRAAKEAIAALMDATAAMKAAKDAAASLPPDAEDGRTDNAVPYIEGQEGMQAFEQQVFVPSTTKKKSGGYLGTGAGKNITPAAASSFAANRKLKPLNLDSEEALTGDVAGASIEKMLEEMPIYRIWNWLCRPEFFGLDNIPDEKPLIFVGNHTMYGIYDMPLMIYELR